MARAIAPWDDHLVPEPDPRLELIFRESVRKLDHQGEVLESLRARTGLLFGAGAVSVSFLAPNALEQHGWVWQAWVATSCLILVSILALAILWPYAWIFSHSPSGMLDVYVEGRKPRSIDGMHKWLAKENEFYFNQNRRRLRLLFGCFQLATVSLLVSVCFWLALLAR